MQIDGGYIARELQMEPLPREGGMIRQTLQTATQSAIYYLLVAPDVSHMHRLPGPEIWHYYGGAPLDMLLLGRRGEVLKPTLGIDLRRGQRPQVTVPGDCWQGARSLGEWTLVGTTMTPPYEPEMVEFGSRDSLTAAWPNLAHELKLLTPGSP